MQSLIVHDDAEVGEQLAGMVADYTEQEESSEPAHPASFKKRGFFGSLRRD